MAMQKKMSQIGGVSVCLEPGQYVHTADTWQVKFHVLIPAATDGGKQFPLSGAMLDAIEANVKALCDESTATGWSRGGAYVRVFVYATKSHASDDDARNDTDNHDIARRVTRALFYLCNAESNSPWRTFAQFAAQTG